MRRCAQACLWLCLCLPGIATACRCGALSLADHVSAAQVVMQVEIDSVVEVDGGAARRAGFRLIRDVKRAAGVRGLITPSTSATCGLSMAPGERYWIFGTQRPGEADLHVDVCNGSRSIDQGFIGTPARDVGKRMSALAEGLACPSPTPAEVARRFAIESVASAGHDNAGERSPNGAYSYLLRQTAADAPTPGSATLVVDTQGPTRMKLVLHRIAEPVEVAWINEKLVFVRATWTSTLRTDLVVDVEERDILVADTAVRQPGNGVWSWLDPDCVKGPRR